jgi:signal peptide peptidase SppA
MIKYSKSAFSQKLFAHRWGMKQEDLNAMALRFLRAFDTDDLNEDPTGEPVNPTIETKTINGVYLVPIFGVLVKHMEGEGVVDYDWIRDEISKGIEDDEAQNILLWWNSPGGEVLGCESTANFIAEANQQKPIISYTDALMCSAAYWCGSQVSRIYCSIDADVGAVGVFSAKPDITDMLKKQGITMNVFTSHPDKVAGHPWDHMSDEHKAMFQADTKEEYDKFLEAVTSKRTISDEYLTGWDYSGEKAVSYGFADGLINSVAETIAFIGKTQSVS